MKKVFLTLGVVGLIFATSCKQENADVVVETPVVEETDTLNVADNVSEDAAYAEEQSNYEAARAKFEEAEASGDQTRIDEAQRELDAASEALATAKSNIETLGEDIETSEDATVDSTQDMNNEVSN